MLGFRCAQCCGIFLCPIPLPIYLYAFLQPKVWGEMSSEQSPVRVMGAFCQPWVSLCCFWKTISGVNILHNVGIFLVLSYLFLLHFRFFFLDFPLVPPWSPPICTNSCSISTVLKWILAIHIDSIIGLFVHHIKLHVWLGSNCFPSFLFVLLSLFHFHFNFGTLEFSCEFLTCVSFIGLWVSCIRCNIRRWRK